MAAVEIAEAAAARRVHALDAPVSGGDVGARHATLSIMVGGPADVFEAVWPCLAVVRGLPPLVPSEHEDHVVSVVGLIYLAFAALRM
jgi:6-phosphogluconate dehydrogenase (decarboxylating)